MSDITYIWSHEDGTKIHSNSDTITIDYNEHTNLTTTYIGDTDISLIELTGEASLEYMTDIINDIYTIQEEQS